MRTIVAMALLALVGCAHGPKATPRADACMLGDSPDTMTYIKVTDPVCRLYQGFRNEIHTVPVDGLAQIAVAFRNPDNKKNEQQELFGNDWVAVGQPNSWKLIYTRNNISLHDALLEDLRCIYIVIGPRGQGFATGDCVEKKH